MEYLYNIICIILGFIAGGLSVHFHYQSKCFKSNQQRGDNIAQSGSIAAGNVNGHITINNTPAPPLIPEISPQAEKILFQFYKTNAEILLTYAPNLIVERLETNSNQEINIDDLLAVNSDLDALRENGLLVRMTDSNAGRTYSWTPKGKNYIKEKLGN